MGSFNENTRVQVPAALHLCKLGYTYLDNINALDTNTNILVDVLDTILQPMRKKMKPYLENKKLVFDLLYNGTMKVKKIVNESMLELRDSIGLVNLDERRKNLGITR